MVRVSKAADTTRLRFVVDNVRTGDYVVSATYSLDSLDKGVGRRYRVYWICSDSTERIGFGGTVIKGGKHAIHHTLISKPGEPKAQLIIDFNHTGTRKGLHTAATYDGGGYTCNVYAADGAVCRCPV